jgi:gluconate 2-dehydrogenase
MQPSGILINISRGDVLDEAALADALTAGRMAGAGLDVYAREPQITPALLALENVTLLPHLGTAVLDVREAMGQIALDNLIAHFEGRALPNAV